MTTVWLAKLQSQQYDWPNCSHYSMTGQIAVTTVWLAKLQSQQYDWPNCSHDSMTGQIAVTTVWLAKLRSRQYDWPNCGHDSMTGQTAVTIPVWLAKLQSRQQYGWSKQNVKCTPRPKQTKSVAKLQKAWTLFQTIHNHHCAFLAVQRKD
jgi:hypothetical protein